MKEGRIDIITMGCSKNLVDSEALIRLLSKKGYECFHDADIPEGEIVVVNTCGFIGDAKEESINVILSLVEAKKTGQIGRLYVMGCLSERYLSDLEGEIPEVDKYYGKFNFKELVQGLPDLSHGKDVDEILTTTPAHYAYIKISEGCDRHCAYCAIPLITGRHRSRPMEEILSEVKELVEAGVKEFQVIAQELTYYGIDLYGSRKIAELISKMSDIRGVEWIRLHYAYPNQFPMELLDVMRETPNVCKYLDIALQHISTSVLERMHRHTSKAETIELINRLRHEVPGISLRTTLMVGFPGETDAEFDELLDFVKWAKFERLGAFAYSEEDGTYSADHYVDDVPEDVKHSRLSKLMRVQQRISAEHMESMIGQSVKVIIDRVEGDYYIGRTEYSSPEVDPEVLIKTSDGNLALGEFYNIKIIGSEEFDLYGSVDHIS